MIGALVWVGTNSALLQGLGAGSNLELELGREAFLVRWRTYDFQVKMFQEAYRDYWGKLGSIERKGPTLGPGASNPRENEDSK